MTAEDKLTYMIMVNIVSRVVYKYSLGTVTHAKKFICQ